MKAAAAAVSPVVHSDVSNLLCIEPTKKSCASQLEHACKHYICINATVGLRLCCFLFKGDLRFIAFLPFTVSILREALVPLPTKDSILCMPFVAGAVHQFQLHHLPAIGMLQVLSLFVCIAMGRSAYNPHRACQIGSQDAKQQQGPVRTIVLGYACAANDMWHPVCIHMACSACEPVHISLAVIVLVSKIVSRT